MREFILIEYMTAWKLVNEVFGINLANMVELVFLLTLGVLNRQWMEFFNYNVQFSTFTAQYYSILISFAQILLKFTWLC